MYNGLKRVATFTVLACYLAGCSASKSCESLQGPDDDPARAYCEYQNQQEENGRTQAILSVVAGTFEVLGAVLLAVASAAGSSGSALPSAPMGSMQQPTFQPSYRSAGMTDPFTNSMPARISVPAPGL